MKKISGFLGRWAVNLLGFGLLILGIIVAPVPGPGGMPLILIGLGVLSIHNHWARRLRLYLINSHKSLSAIIFPKNIWARRAWDLGGAIALGLGLSLLFSFESIWFRIGGTILSTGALLIWGSNNQRAERLLQFFNRWWKGRQ